MTFHRFKSTRTPCPLIGHHPTRHPHLLLSPLPFSPHKHHLIVPSALPLLSTHSQPLRCFTENPPSLPSPTHVVLMIEVVRTHTAHVAIRASRGLCGCISVSIRVTFSLLWVPSVWASHVIEPRVTPPRPQRHQVLLGQIKAVRKLQVLLQHLRSHHLPVGSPP